MDYIRLKLYRVLLTILLILFLSCNKNDNIEIKKVYCFLNKSFSDTLQMKSVSNITQMRLEIIGKLNGEGTLYYSHFPFNLNYKVKLKDSVNQVISTDWYDSRCLIKYIPKDSSTKGKLNINFQVISL